MAGRAHLTIGEVLTLLKEEFPDVSISKIRFLESQGLVDPERTPSGYRKFYDQDVARLRWILQQQREHFLPLKVIKGRLSDPADEAGAADDGAGDELSTAVPPVAAAANGRPDPPAVAAAADPPEPEAVPGPPAPEPPAGAGPPAEPPAAPPAAVAADPPAPEPARGRGGRRPAAREPKGPPAVIGGQPDVYTVEELAEAAGCETQLVKELQQYGLIVANATVAGVAYFDPDAVDIARTGSGFAAVGIEPRHLRAWRNSADREASLYEQLVMPLLRQRNPQARGQAAALLEELAELGGQLRSGLVREAIRAIR